VGAVPDPLLLRNPEEQGIELKPPNINRNIILMIKESGPQIRANRSIIQTELHMLQIGELF
jgi:hypothetical protein